MDVFQDRYLEHQERKTNSLVDFSGNDFCKYTVAELKTFKKILENRRSQRIFNDEELLEEEIDLLKFAVKETPSSCNRQAIYLKEIKLEDAERLLVGGKNWVNKGQVVYGIFASDLAYKSPNERDFMAYLDAGFVGQSLYLMSEVIGIGSCFVNPNIREENKEEFSKLYNKDGDFFCGAMVFGRYDKKAKRPPKRDIKEVVK